MPDQLPNAPRSVAPEHLPSPAKATTVIVIDRPTMLRCRINGAPIEQAKRLPVGCQSAEFPFEHAAGTVL
jgi:hypothetical protein